MIYIHIYVSKAKLAKDCITSVDNDLTRTGLKAGRSANTRSKQTKPPYKPIS